MNRIARRMFSQPFFQAPLTPLGCLVLLLGGLVGCSRQTAGPRESRGEVVVPVVKESDIAHAAAASHTVRPAADRPPAWSVREIVGSEELILQLTPRLRPLTRDVLNLRLPVESQPSLFQPSTRCWHLMPGLITAAPDEGRLGLRHWTMHVAADGAAGPEATETWRALFQEVAYFEHAKFSLVSGHFTDANWNQFESELMFRGLARRTTGSWLDVHVNLRIAWQRLSPEASGDVWRIAEWQPTKVALTEGSSLMFADVLADCIPTAQLQQSLRESQHWVYATRHYYPKLAARLPATTNDPRFFAISTAYHPGLAVVDIDQDGWDDLYLTDRWGKNLLLRNQADGSFAEVAAQYGLDIDGRSNAAVFADFDNDGDLDLMLARSMERSQYLVNDNGRFVDRSADLVSFPLPLEAASLSVADHNRDGLLDVYFCTYHQDDISRRLDADLAHPDHRIHKTLTPEHSAELRRRFRAETRSFINQVGPPNILLTNVGNGRFELAAQNATVASWRNSFQSSWMDFDQDGDPDLYVANDFAPDNLLRNDGAAGFRDVADELGIDQLGFAMGASWGDYDNDGRTDLYVSNMFSKAGQRITSQVDQLDPRIAQLANGNYLYRYDGQRFHLVSGLAPPALTVARTGWSWGGQFLDANNDRFLDLFVPNGYYTVPASFETDVDL
jgi:hypothetical protein